MTDRSSLDATLLPVLYVVLLVWLVIVIVPPMVEWVRVLWTRESSSPDALLEQASWYVLAMGGALSIAGLACVAWWL